MSIQSPMNFNFVGISFQPQPVRVVWEFGKNLIILIFNLTTNFHADVLTDRQASSTGLALQKQSSNKPCCLDNFLCWALAVPPLLLLAITGIYLLPQEPAHRFMIQMLNNGIPSAVIMYFKLRLPEPCFVETY